jgi:hypothetical protein
MGPRVLILLAGLAVASAGGSGRQRDISCNGGGKATAGELQVFAMWPIARSTPDHRHRTTPDEHPDMRFKSADQSMITDSQGFAPTVARS